MKSLMGNRIILFLLKALCTCGLYLGLEQLIELKTHGFCLQKIQADDLAYQVCWETPPLAPSEKAAVDALLAQPFYLIGAGSECFAFVSADGQAVIKFFKLNYTR